MGNSTSNEETKTQQQKNTEGLMKALKDDSIDFAKGSGTINSSEGEEESQKIKEALSAKEKCKQEVENEWEKLEMMMKALPDEAKQKLYESRLGNDPNKDLT